MDKSHVHKLTGSLKELFRTGDGERVCMCMCGGIGRCVSEVHNVRDVCVCESVE